MRFREDNHDDLARARAAVADWRSQNPLGTDQELLAAVGHQFHREWAVVLRAVLFVVDRHRAREVTVQERRAPETPWRNAASASG